MKPLQALTSFLATVALTATATAENTAGSLLIFPEFNNHIGVHNILTITNTNAESDVLVEIIYIDGDDCHEFNREIYLTPNDTFTFLTRFHNPNQEHGYAYAFAKD